MVNSSDKQPTFSDLPYMLAAALRGETLEEYEVRGAAELAAHEAMLRRSPAYWLGFALGLFGRAYRVVALAIADTAKGIGRRIEAGFDRGAGGAP